MSPSLKLTDLAGVILVYVFTALASLVFICVFAPFRERLRYGKSRSGSQPNSVPSNNDEGEMKETEEISASTFRREPVSVDSRSDYNTREVNEAKGRVGNGRDRGGVGKNEGTLAMEGGRGGDGVNNEVLERRLNVVKQQMGVVERQIGTTSKGGTWASLSSLSRGNHDITYYCSLIPVPTISLSRGNNTTHYLRLLLKNPCLYYIFNSFHPLAKDSTT